MTSSPDQERDQRAGLRLALPLGLLLYSVINLVVATSPWMPDALSEGLNLSYLVKADHALRALYAWFGGSGANGEQIYRDLTWQGFPYGPLLYISGALSEWVFGRGDMAHLLPVTVGTALAIASSADIASRLTGKRSAGLWAAALLGTMPMVLYYSRHYTTDSLIMGLGMAACAAALRSEGFRRPGWTLLMGLCMGLGILAKPTVGHFVAVPLTIYAAHRFLLGRPPAGRPDEAQPPLRERLLRGGPWLLAALLLCALIGVQYMHHFLYDYARKNFEVFGLGVTSAWGIEPWEIYPRFGHEHLLHWLLFYPRMMFRYQLGTPLLILCLGGAGAALVLRKPGARWAFAAVLAPLLLYTAMGAKKWYYTLPLLPWMAVLGALGIDGLLGLVEQRWRARLALILASVIGATGLWAGLIGGSGPMFNRPAILHLVPGGEPLRGADFAHVLAREILRDGGSMEELAIVEPPLMKTAYTARSARLYAFMHQVQGEVTRFGLFFGGHPLHDRLQIWSKLTGDGGELKPRWLLFVSPGEGAWMQQQDLSSWPSGGPPGDSAPKRARDAEILAFGERLEPLISASVPPFTITLSRVR